MGNGLSGVGVYSRELLKGLSHTPDVHWDWFYRSQRYWRALQVPVPNRVTRKFLSDSWGSRSAALFHGLNQRLPRRRFKRQIATFHDLFVLSGEYSTPQFRQRFAAQAREAAAGADLIIAVSAFTAGQVERYLDVAPDRIRVIHHGVLSRALPHALPDVAREKVVLCVGALQRRKNQATLVRAFRALPPGWKLVLAGSAGFAADEVMTEIAASPRKADILVTGFVSDTELAEWYGRASIFAFPTRDEGFGMPVLEAMSAGLPVIAGSGSAITEVCGDAAMLVDPEREDELAEALVHLSIESEFRHTLVSRGLEHARLFTWDKAVKSTLAVYRELL